MKSAQNASNATKGVEIRCGWTYVDAGSVKSLFVLFASFMPEVPKPKLQYGLPRKANTYIRASRKDHIIIRALAVSSPVVPSGKARSIAGPSRLTQLNATYEETVNFVSSKKQQTLNTPSLQLTTHFQSRTPSPKSSRSLRNVEDRNAPSSEQVRGSTSFGNIDEQLSSAAPS